MTQKTVAVIGASSDRSKYGNKSVRAHLQANYAVFPVNPKGGEIEGQAVYARVVEIPVELDRISLYLPPQLGVKLLSEIAAKGCGELWLNPGSESDALIDEAHRLGLNTVVGCSIVDLGVSPAEFS